ncbi:hypothetical protein [Methylocella sp.]|uniref:hypothetical protein n=1 Tax=Methylocella sp. TaxID=1978226 RepID=UPI00378417F3
MEQIEIITIKETIRLVAPFDGALAERLTAVLCQMYEVPDASRPRPAADASPSPAPSRRGARWSPKGTLH